jgi:hypothetical protein
MRRAIAILVVFLLAFGCLSETPYKSSRSEQQANMQAVDLNNDTVPDYMQYDYAPSTASGAGLSVQRQVTVSVETNGTFLKINPNLTDVDLILADQSLDEFSKSRTQADTACSQAIGLSNVVCSDITTCTRLCSAASQKCRKIAATYDEALAGSMISYVADNNQMRSLILDARRMVVNLRNASEGDRNAFFSKTRDMIAEVADVNSNPLYTDPDLALCSHDDFGVGYIDDALARIGTYESGPVSYHYRVMLSVKPVADASDVAGVTLTDRMPLADVQPDQVQSIQQISATSDAASAVVSWSSTKPSKDGYVMYYEFNSPQPPEEVLASLRTPDISVKRLNLVLLGPTAAVMDAIYGMTKNYYVAMGAALGLTIDFLFVIYNIAILALAVVSERAAGFTLTAAFRKAFGRTDVRWKTDIVIALVLLAGGFYIASVMAPQPASPPPLIQSLDFLLQNGMGAVAIAVILLGSVMIYFAIENFTKLTILERAYGMVIKHEKDLFTAKSASLKDRLKELEGLIEEYTKEEFDVSKEYDVLTSVRSEKFDATAKDMTARTKAILDDSLSKVENAVSSLKERKKLADANWPKWKEGIAKMLDEQGEVYTSSLVTVPASLRPWALGKFVREEGTEGLTMERDSIKKRKITPSELVQDMISRGLIKGAIVMKQDKIVLSEFAEGSGTVLTALALKLKSYTQSLGKNIGQGTPTGFTAIGGKTVVVMTRNRGIDSVLFLGKDKFNAAMEQWQSKMKIFESG